MYEGYLRNRRTTELLAKLPRPPGADNSIPLHPIQFLALSGEGIPLSTDKFATLFGVFFHRLIGFVCHAMCPLRE